MNLIVIERENDRPLAVSYESVEHAKWALNGSLFVEDLCAQDCLDCYLAGSVPEGAEVIVAPAVDEDVPVAA